MEKYTAKDEQERREEEAAAAEEEEEEEETAPAMIMDADTTKSADTAKMTDDTKVKFTNHQLARNGDAKVEIEGIQVAFAGMGKEELMKFANDPFWIRMRWALLILFWLVWLSMLVGAIVIVVFAKRCDPLPTLDWWQKNVMYEVSPARFQDSDGNSIGDLKGMKARVDYLEDLGVQTLLLDSIYETDGEGVAVTNYTEVAERFGTLEDFSDLVKALDEKDIKVVLVLKPGQTSQQSSWFKNSRQGIAEYKDYYIWKDKASQNGPGKVKWDFDETRRQYYLLHEGQPLLNLTNMAVQNEIKEIMHMWLDRGVSGFQVTDTEAYFQHEVDKEALQKINLTDALDGVVQSDALKLLAEWRKILTDYEEEHGGGHRLLTLDTDEDRLGIAKYYANGTQLIDFPVNTAFRDALRENVTGGGVTAAIQDYMDALPPGAWPNWKIGISDSAQINPQLIDGLHMITMLLIGTPITVSGEELGVMKQPVEGAVLLSMNQTEALVKEQRELSHSHFKVFKHLVKLRKQDAIKFGSLGVMNVSNQLVTFCRIKKGTPGFLVMANFQNTSDSVDLKKLTSVPTKYGGTASSSVEFKFPDDGTLELTSSNVPKQSVLYNVESKVKVKFHGIEIGPYEAIVIKFVPSFPQS